MYTSAGLIQDRSPRRLPDCPPNREHPKDGSLVYRKGRGGLLSLPEVIKNNRQGMMSSRSKLAVTSSSANAQVFVKTQVRTDRNIDCPVEEFVPVVRSCRGLGTGKGIARGIRRA